MPDKIPHLDGARIDIVVVVEIIARNLAAGVSDTLRFASRNVRPAGIAPIRGLIASAPTWGEAVWGEDNRPLSVAAATVGQVVIFNDGSLYHMRHHELSRGTVRVLIGAPSDAWADYIEVLSGRLGGREWSADGRQLRILITPHRVQLDGRTVPSAVFGTDYHGVPVNPELVGSTIPRAFGSRSDQALLINGGHLIYMITGASCYIHDAYEYADPTNPLQLIHDGDVATVADLMAATVAGGHWVGCPSLGLGRLGGVAPNSDIRWLSASHDDLLAGWDSTAEAIRWVASMAGLGMHEADLVQLRADWPESAVLYLNQVTELRELLVGLARQAGCQLVLADGAVRLAPVPMAPGVPDHEMRFGGGGRFESDLSLGPDVAPFYLGELQAATNGVVVSGVRQAIQFYDNAAHLWLNGQIAEPIVTTFTPGYGGLERAHALWSAFMTTPWRTWVITTSWDGTVYRAGETLAVSSVAWGLSDRPMLIVAVDYVLQVPAGRSGSRAMTVKLRVAEVRDGG